MSIWQLRVVIPPSVFEIALHRHFWKQIDLRVILGVTLLSAAISYEFWPWGLLGGFGVVVGFAALVLLRFLMALRRSEDFARASGGRELSLTVDSRGIEFEREPQIGYISWRGVIELLLYDDLWIVYTTAGVRLPLLPNEIPEEAQRWILQNLTVSQALIVDRRSKGELAQ